MDCIVESKNKLIEVISMNKESSLVKMYYSILGNIDIDLLIVIDFLFVENSIHDKIIKINLSCHCDELKIN